MKTLNSRKFTTFLAMPIVAAGILGGAGVATAAAANAAGFHGGTTATHTAVGAAPQSALGGSGNAMIDASGSKQTCASCYSVGETTQGVVGSTFPDGRSALNGGAQLTAAPGVPTALPQADPADGADAAAALRGAGTLPQAETAVGAEPQAETAAGADTSGNRPVR